MDVITCVLNKLFDEDNIHYYIGDYHKKYPITNNNQKNTQQPFEINNKINSVLNNIDTRIQYIKRKNLGVPMFQEYSNKSILRILYSKAHNKKRKKTHKKIKPYYD